jgi:hypothetical protein
MSQLQGSTGRGAIVISIRTLRLEELQLAVQELKVRFGEDDFGDIFLASTRTSTNIARLSHGITVVDDLHLGGVRVLRRHCVEYMQTSKRGQRGKLIRRGEDE